MHTISVAAYQAAERTDVVSICDCIHESDTRTLAIARDCVVDAEFAKERFWRNPKCCASRDQFCVWSCFTQRPQNDSRFGCVMPKRDRVAVVYVANRNADDRRGKL